VPAATAPLVRLWVSNIAGDASCPTTVTLASSPTFREYNSTNYAAEPWIPIPFSPCVATGDGLPYFEPLIQFLGQLVSPDVGVELNYITVETVPSS
jgi:hypothetical protein